LKTKIIAVAGPTASGKTSLAIEIAKRVGGEVISNDSMQVYRGMEIGTAAPTLEEMDGIVHHMVGVCDPTDEFSCADYAERARRIIDDVAKRGRVPVFCGGTGLYLDAVLSVSDLSESGKDEGVRERLSAFAEKEGNEALHARLRKVDPEAADAIHKNNVRRVIRALEIYETTGITKTEWDRRSKERELPYDVSMAIIEFSDRELLYSRIDRRVEIMMESGLLTEVKALFEKGIRMGTHIASIGGIRDQAYDPISPEIDRIREGFPVLDAEAGERMKAEILAAAEDGDSVGGVLETAVVGMPTGVGEPWFDTVEGLISQAMFSIPAVKGVEFGRGFDVTTLRGSEANDPFTVSDRKIVTETNNSGGINGGITNGMPIIFRVAVKPTPSIYKEQRTVNVGEMTDTTLSIEGRHDPAIIHRAGVVVEAMTALTLADMLAGRFGTDWLR